MLREFGPRILVERHPTSGFIPLWHVVNRLRMITGPGLNPHQYTDPHEVESLTNAIKCVGREINRPSSSVSPGVTCFEYVLLHDPGRLDILELFLQHPYFEPYPPANPHDDLYGQLKYAFQHDRVEVVQKLLFRQSWFDINRPVVEDKKPLDLVITNNSCKTFALILSKPELDMMGFRRNFHVLHELMPNYIRVEMLHAFVRLLPEYDMNPRYLDSLGLFCLEFCLDFGFECGFSSSKSS